MVDTPRIVPEKSLPPYSYVPGQFPHPQSDPEGHSFGQEHEPSRHVPPEEWVTCRDYLWGLDLFNHGYYWEAHEVWEGLWHAAGRTGTQGNFFKALIKLAAAGVKARENVRDGVRSHATRAQALFDKVREDIAKRDEECFMGLRIQELIDFAAGLAQDPIVGDAGAGRLVERVLPTVLIPQ